jgi:GAF domain-containing protein
VHIAESEIEFRQKQLIEGEDFVSVYTVPLIIKGQVRGVLDIFNRSELHPDQAWLDFLETLAKQTAIAIDNATLSEGLQKSNMDLIRQANRRRVGGNAQAYTICV